MLKQNKKLIILTAIITLLPILMGVALWEQLPDQIATHFDFNGQPDDWSSKPFAVFGLPAILFAIHLLCTLGTAADPHKQNISGKMLRLVLWVCPVISVALKQEGFMPYTASVLINRKYLHPTFLTQLASSSVSFTLTASYFEYAVSPSSL